MESGHDPLLGWLNKPGDATDVLDAVRTLKAAGLNVSVIVMLGVGGDRYAAGHVADTVALLNAMPLAGGDLIYFSDFVDTPDAPYAGLAAEAGVHALDFAGLRQQEAAIRAGFPTSRIQIILRRCRGMILKSSFTDGCDRSRSRLRSRMGSKASATAGGQRPSGSHEPSGTES